MSVSPFPRNEFFIRAEKQAAKSWVGTKPMLPGLQKKLFLSGIEITRLRKSGRLPKSGGKFCNREGIVNNKKIVFTQRKRM